MLVWLPVVLTDLLENVCQATSIGADHQQCYYKYKYKHKYKIQIQATSRGASYHLQWAFHRPGNLPPPSLTPCLTISVLYAAKVPEVIFCFCIKYISKM